MKKIKLALAMSALIVSNIALADLNDGLIAHWNFDDCSATDVTGKLHSGTIQGNPQCADSLQGKALSFNGNCDFIEIPDVNGEFSTSDLSISVWIKPNSDQSDYAAIIDKSHMSVSGGWVFQKSAIGSGLPFFFSYCDFTGTAQCAQWDGNQRITVKLNTWNHLVVTKAKNVVANYLNGKLTSKKTYTFSNYPKTSFTLFIGAANATNSATRYFSGSIDEPRFYNRALTTSEVSELYNVVLPVSGVIESLSTHTISCKNETTGQIVDIPKVSSTTYDCEAKGLKVNVGDGVSILIKGNAQ